jgi:hypothetical protein
MTLTFRATWQELIDVERRDHAPRRVHLGFGRILFCRLTLHESTTVLHRLCASRVSIYQAHSLALSLTRRWRKILYPTPLALELWAKLKALIGIFSKSGLKVLGQISQIFGPRAN